MKIEPTKFKVLEVEKSIQHKSKLDEDGNPLVVYVYGLFDLRPVDDEDDKKRKKIPFKQQFDYCWKLNVIEIGQGVKAYSKGNKLNMKYVWQLALYTNDCETWVEKGDIIQCNKLQLKKPTYKKGKEWTSSIWLESKDYELIKGEKNE